MPDTVAKRLADRASELFGELIDIKFAAWDEAGPTQKDFWRELARVSQEPKAKPKKADA